MLYLMRGVSGSGKTTYAKTLNAERVSRDDIRAELTGRSDKFAGDSKFEAQVTRVQKERVRDLLIARKDVVIDDTNLIDKHAVEWLNMAHDYGHAYDVLLADTSLDMALYRNATREGAVPESVIRRQWSKWVNIGEIHPTHPFVDWSRVGPHDGVPAITCDIDGTLALLAEGYSPYDPAHYPHDTLNVTVREVYHTLLGYYSYGTSRPNPLGILLTGRGEEHREATEEWLRRNGVVYDELHMRKAGDNRRDDVVKSEKVNEHIVAKGRTIVAHFDDRDRVVKMFRARGVPTFQVADGDF